MLTKVSTSTHKISFQGSFHQSQWSLQNWRTGKNFIILSFSSTAFSSDACYWHIRSCPVGIRWLYCHLWIHYQPHLAGVHHHWDVAGRHSSHHRLHTAGRHCSFHFGRFKTNIAVVIEWCRMPCFVWWGLSCTWYQEPVPYTTRLAKPAPRRGTSA